MRVLPSLCTLLCTLHCVAAARATLDAEGPVLSVLGDLFDEDLKGATGIQIFIETQAGLVLRYDVASSETVRGLKLRIMDAEGLNAALHALSFEGHPLPNDRTLFSCGIRTGSILHLTRHPHGKLNVVVKTLSGMSIALKVAGTESIRNLKERIQDSEGLPVDRQRLIFNATVLGDSSTLWDYEIEDGSIIYMVAQPQLVKIYLKLWPRRSEIVMTVERSDTVKHVKTRIFDSIAIEPDQLRLIFAGRVLEDERTLMKYGIQTGSIIHVVQRPRLMPIFVKTVNGNMIAVRIGERDTIGNLKMKVLDSLGIDLDQQRLIFAGKLLEDRRTVAQCGIKKHSIVYVIRRPRLMSVFVKTADGKHASVSLEGSDTVGDLKARIQDSFGIAKDQQRLISDGKLLVDERKLSEYEIRSGSTVHVVLRPSLMPISVQTLNGTVITIRVEHTDTIANVKARIQDSVSIVSDHDHLFFGGKELHNGRTLSDYGIQSGSNLYLVRLPQKLLISG